MPAPTSTQFAVAVHLLTYLAVARDMAPIGSPVLADSVSATPEYVRRVLTPLRSAGVVTSTSGAKGGWMLMQSADSITLADVRHILGTEEPLIAMHGPNPKCNVGRAVAQGLADVERDLDVAVAKRLHETTIADLLPLVTP